MRFKNRRYQFS